jgi:hypothetical protein
MFVVEG